MSSLALLRYARVAPTQDVLDFAAGGFVIIG